MIFAGASMRSDKFAADAVAGGEFAADFGDSSAKKFFVELGEFASCDYAEGWTEHGLEIGQSVERCDGELRKR